MTMLALPPLAILHETRKLAECSKAMVQDLRKENIWLRQLLADHGCFPSDRITSLVKTPLDEEIDEILEDNALWPEQS